LMATIVGAVGLVLGATGVFGQLQDSLNTIWGVTTKPGQGIWAFIRDRFFSMAMVLGVGFLLLISMALTAFVTAFTHYISSLVSLPEWVAPVFENLLSFIVISILFALIFKVLPDVKIRWRDVWVGALGTALLFTAGKYLLGLYLGHAAGASAYGAGSAFVVILLYVYYSSLILYFGAEFTQVFAKHQGAHIEPSKYAVQVTDQQRAEQGMPRNRQVEDAARRQQPARSPADNTNNTNTLPKSTDRKD
ncbi:MAG TPA: YihY/virulence factor BrkB family protein, partial [Bacillota bacterium]|nr:YihY/virulence factor BrkB family protein [Bacillota bacterium]